jgi:hypothetical protein
MKINRFKLFPLLLGLLIAWSFQTVSAQPLANVTAKECVSGDCSDGRGRLEVATQWGKGQYFGHFKQGEFHGKGRLEVPISFTQKSIYDGEWEMGRRSGRGTHWSGDGNLYIGQWKNDRRHGQGTFRWPGGQKYQGGFFANKKHGPGTYYYSTGSARYQLWEYGDFVR